MIRYPFLPKPTPLDLTDVTPSGVDPLGTLGPAERMADILFPGLTARMWRPRLLTFAAVASKVAELASKPDDSGLDARLRFERLFVSALVRQQEREGQTGTRAARKLPGSMLARRALQFNDVALGANNFLKGQAVNGPFGVMARLARHVGIIDEEDHLKGAGEKLLKAWSEDEHLKGLLDDDHADLKGGNDSKGGKWLKACVKKTLNSEWPNSGWSDLAKHLRLDKTGGKEGAVLRELLDGAPIRARCLKLLCKPAIKKVYRDARYADRGIQESKTLDAVRKAIENGESEEDRVISMVIRLADAYEVVASYLETAFNCLRWGLTRYGGQAKREDLQVDKQLQPVFGSLCVKLPVAAKKLRALIEKVADIPRNADADLCRPLDDIASQAEDIKKDPSRLIETVLARHRDIQALRHKVVWIDSGDRLTLMPGFGLAEPAPPKAGAKYLHTFRILNAYSFLADLGLPGVEVPDEDA